MYWNKQIHSLKFRTLPLVKCLNSVNCNFLKSILNYILDWWRAFSQQFQPSITNRNGPWNSCFTHTVSNEQTEGHFEFHFRRWKNRHWSNFNLSRTILKCRKKCQLKKERNENVSEWKWEKKIHFKFFQTYSHNFNKL